MDNGRDLMSDGDYIAAINRDLMVERARAEAAEARVAELEAAIWAASKNLRINGREPEVADFLEQVLEKGEQAK
jgi:hypothetical protein